MAASYGYDIGKPAKNSFEATQWTYFAYLELCKGTRWSGYESCVSTFLDIYYERDLKNGQY